jgi:rhodanese-related sulfurtransferase
MMGNIPSSVNVPLSNFEKALDMDDSDFLRAYGFRKPKKDQKMIFYCKAGVRAGSAAGLAKDKGWKNVRNYPGSYDEVGSLYICLRGHADIHLPFYCSG